MAATGKHQQWTYFVEQEWGNSLLEARVSNTAKHKRLTNFEQWSQTSVESNHLEKTLANTNLPVDDVKYKPHEDNNAFDIEDATNVWRRDWNVCVIFEYDN